MSIRGQVVHRPVHLSVSGANNGITYKLWPHPRLLPVRVTLICFVSLLDTLRRNCVCRGIDTSSEVINDAHVSTERSTNADSSSGMSPRCSMRTDEEAVTTFRTICHLSFKC